MEITLLVMENHGKIMEFCVFEFLWETCIMSSFLAVTDSIDKEGNCGKCTGPSVSSICKDLVNTLLEQCQCKYISYTHIYIYVQVPVFPIYARI